MRNLMRRSKRERRTPCKIQTLNMILFDADEWVRIAADAGKAVLAARS